MDGNLTLLDKSLIAKQTIDKYSSFIWTERFNTYGDFEVQIPIENTEQVRSLLEVGDNGQTKWMDSYVRISDSKRLMILEQFRTSTSEDEGDVLIITGRSLESLLMRRIVWGLKILKGNLQNAIHSLMDDCFINPSIPDRAVSNFVFVDNDDPRIADLTIQAQYTGDNLYDVISGICIDRAIGFKIELNDLNQFEFSLYAGEDRSYNQNENSYIVFSPNFDNLLTSDYLESNAFLKNVTLIGGEGEGINRKYAEYGSGVGIDRREMFTDARDLSSNPGGFKLLSKKPSDWSTNWTSYYENVGSQADPVYENLSGESAPTWVSNTYYEYDSEVVLTNEEYEATLIERGQKDLSENKSVKSFDGKVDPFTMYTYGNDFFMGDIVEVADAYGHETRSRVTEFIRAIDQSGYSVYPSFSLVDEEENNDNN